MKKPKKITRLYAIRWDLVILVILVVAAFGLRLIALTNPPLSPRQLHSAIIARGMYYQMLPDNSIVYQREAIRLYQTIERYEPPILERIVAITYYVAGAEHLWIARLYSSVFWILGGLALYGLAKRITSVSGGLAALAFYLFIPFGVVNSRSFMPDAFMVMWMLFALYSLYRWHEELNWKWAILTGLFAGLAALVKVFAAVFLAPPLVAVTVSNLGIGRVFKNRQVWMIAVLSIAVPAVYYLSNTTRSAGYFTYWTLSFSNLLFHPRFYILWLDMLDYLLGGSALFASLVGLVLLPTRGRTLIFALWIGYGIFGLMEPYQIYTHDYYSLALLPIVALSLPQLFSLVIEKLMQQPRLWQIFVIVVVILTIAITSWLARNELVYPNNAPEVAGWIKMGEELPRDGRIIGLTQDYTFRLAYFGILQVDMWPYVADYNMNSLRNGNENEGTPDESIFDSYFQTMVAGHKYFLVTLFTELDAQPLLKAKLYSTYPIYQEGDGYILFDLEHPISSP